MSDPQPARARDIGVTGAAQYRDTALYENSWALVVGIDSYRHASIPALQFAENDALAMVEMLPSLGFPRENIRLRLGSRGEVSRQQIQHVVEHDLNRSMSPHDRLLVHFAGHGVSAKVWGKMSGYLLMPDSEIAGELPSPDNPFLERMPTDALEMRQFLDLLGNLPAKHKLMLIDTCFSGFMANTRAIEQVKVNDARVPLWAEQPATHVLTAGRAGQRAFEDPAYQHGVFTWFVLKGLRGNADPRGDGLITFFDLANYVRHEVAALGRPQDPQSMTGDQDGVFMFVNARTMEREAARRQAEAEEQERQRAAETARKAAELRAQEEQKRQAAEVERQRAAEAARKAAELRAQEEQKRQAAEIERQRAAEAPRKAAPTPQPQTTPKPAAKPAIAVPAASKPGPPVEHRIFSFLGGLLACAAATGIIFGVHDFLNRQAHSSFTPPSASPAITTTEILFLIFVVRGVHYGTTEEPHNIFNLTFWPWIVLSVLGLTIFGWDARSTVLVVTYCIGVVLGLIQACTAK